MSIEVPEPPHKPFLSFIVRRWKYISPVLDLIAAIVLFFHLIPTPFEENLKETSLGIAIIFFIVFIFLIVQNIRQSWNVSTMLKKREELTDMISELTKQNQLLQYENKRAEIYKKTFTYNNKAFAKLREAHREDLNESNKKNLYKAIQEFCENLHEIFTTLNGADPKNPCHVCIKIFILSANQNLKNQSNVKIKLRTFMRDGRGLGQRAKIDESKLDHFVHENTDFLEIFESAGDGTKPRHFFCNDIVNYPEYKNSSFKYHYSDGSFKFKYEHASEDIKEKKWPLPYRSVITTPVCPGISNPNFNKGNFIGFLCCDYQEKNMFTEEDVAIVAGFSEGLYDVLDYYIKQYMLKSYYK